MEKNHHQVPKQQERHNNTSTNERLKRDEWSEGAVSSLLESYESKWTLRNRAKLKGQDWEDVANHVSGRVAGSKSAKTQTQCKNKIESMKKRYRSESAAAGATSSTWPLYHRLDLLLRGAGVPAAAGANSSFSVVPPAVEIAHNSHGSNGGDRVAKEEEHSFSNGAKLTSLNGDKSEKVNPIDDNDSDSSTAPAIYTETKDTKVLEDPLKKTISKCESEDRNNNNNNNNNNNKRAREGYWDEIGESIRWVAEVMVRSEQARMETMKEIEKMRAEAEAKRGEIDLKRTEIIANTQLQIAKLFAKGECNKKLA